MAVGSWVRSLSRAGGPAGVPPGGAGEARLAWLIGLAGGAAAVLFVVVGVAAGLEAYGDGALFSYAVASGESWTFHWHNIPVRVFVYFWAMLPAELYARVTGDGAGAVALYGFLFFSAQAVGLLLTRRLDDTDARTFFQAAALSTAVLCPLVFGFPTEMWFAHAVFWPTLALSHRADGAGRGRLAALLFAFAALVLSHEGGVVLAAGIVVTLALRGPADVRLRRAGVAFGAAMTAWIAIRVAVRPDDYFAGVLEIAALGFIEPANLASRVVVVIVAAVTGHAVLRSACRRLGSRGSAIGPVAIVVAALAAYWLTASPDVHAADRYPVRTVLLLATAAIGGLATLIVIERDGGLWRPLAESRLGHWLVGLTRGVRGWGVRGAAGALTVVLAVHVVETARFVSAWGAYLSAVRGLAMSADSDSALGSERFASSVRLPAGVRALDWESTTPFLSVLVAPKLTPARLVVEPQAVYVWASCAAARRHESGAAGVPTATRALIAAHTCHNRN